MQKLKFHGEDQSILGDFLIRFAALGMFAYATFNCVAGALSVHTDLKNLLILATGGITIIQVCIINATFSLVFVTQPLDSLILIAGHFATFVHH